MNVGKMRYWFVKINIGIKIQMNNFRIIQTMMQLYEYRIIQITILKNVGTLERWNVRILEYWNVGMLERWNVRMLGNITVYWYNLLYDRLYVKLNNGIINGLNNHLYNNKNN